MFLLSLKTGFSSAVIFTILVHLSLGHLHKKSFRTNNFGKFSVTVSAIDSWNKIQDQMGEIALKDLRPSKIKLLLTSKFIKSYWLIYFSFYQTLFIILCNNGIVLLYLYDSIFLNHTIASKKLNIYVYMYMYANVYIYIWGEYRPFLRLVTTFGSTKIGAQISDRSTKDIILILFNSC